MDMFKKIIITIFDTKIEQYSKTLPDREFISKQLKLLDTKLQLLSFLGRKKDSNIRVLIPSEKIDISHSGSTEGKVRVIVVSDNFETYDERTTGREFN